MSVSPPQPQGEVTVSVVMNATARAIQEKSKTGFYVPGENWKLYSVRQGEALFKLNDARLADRDSSDRRGAVNVSLNGLFQDVEETYGRDDPLAVEAISNRITVVGLARTFYNYEGGADQGGAVGLECVVGGIFPAKADGHFSMGDKVMAVPMSAHEYDKRMGRTSTKEEWEKARLVLKPFTSKSLAKIINLHMTRMLIDRAKWSKAMGADLEKTNKLQGALMGMQDFAIHCGLMMVKSLLEAQILTPAMSRHPQFDDGLDPARKNVARLRKRAFNGTDNTTTMESANAAGVGDHPYKHGITDQKKSTSFVTLLGRMFQHIDNDRLAMQGLRGAPLRGAGAGDYAINVDPQAVESYSSLRTHFLMTAFASSHDRMYGPAMFNFLRPEANNWGGARYMNVDARNKMEDSPVSDMTRKQIDAVPTFMSSVFDAVSSFNSRVIGSATRDAKPGEDFGVLLGPGGGF